jgi:hypothetical protein
VILLRAAGVAAALAAVALSAAAEPEVCTTVEGAPASTSESLVEGMLRELREGDREGLQQFLATGQTLLLYGGKPAEIVKRDSERRLVQFRRGPGQLPLWTWEGGLSCPQEEPAPPAH